MLPQLLGKIVDIVHCNVVLSIVSNLFKFVWEFVGTILWTLRRDFWDIASKMGIPWCVTANLVARHNVDDGMCFDLRFPRIGGGEDVNFCRSKSTRGKEGFHTVPNVRVTHAYCSEGVRSYCRFYMWSRGMVR